MQHTKTITILYPKILTICYLEYFGQTGEMTWSICSFRVCHYMQKINKLARLFPEILAIWENYSKAIRTCPNMPNRNQQKWQNQFLVSINVCLFAKNKTHSTKITQPFPYILANYFETLLACSGNQNPTKMTFWLLWMCHFYSKASLGKTNEKKYWKKRKLYFEGILGAFYPNMAKWKFFQKFELCQIFRSMSDLLLYFSEDLIQNWLL